MSPINCCLMFMVAIVWLAPIQRSMGQQDDIYQMRKAYVKLNDCLANSWKDSKGLDDGMKLIDRCTCPSLANCFRGDNLMKEAGAMLKQLTKLTQDQSMCFSRGYEILKDNLKYSQNLPYLSKLINGFIASNGEYCEPIFASLAQRPTDDGMDEKERQSFRKFTSNLLEEASGISEEKMELILRETIEQNSFGLLDYIKRTFGVKKSSVDLKNLLHTTALEADPYKPSYEKYINDYELNQDSMKEDEFSRTILRWLVQPCGDFVEAMDKRKMFQMASVQTKVLKRNFKFVGPHDHGKVNTSVWDLVGFYMDWIRYESCKAYALAGDIFEQVKETRKMILGDYDDNHYVDYIRVKLPDPTIVKLDELIE